MKKQDKCSIAIYDESTKKWEIRDLDRLVQDLDKQQRRLWRSISESTAKIIRDAVLSTWI